MVVALIIFLATILVVYNLWNMNGFQRRGVRTLPSYFIVGNMWAALTKKKHLLQIVDEAYAKFNDEKYFGFYQFKKAFFVIKDIETIKRIATTDYEYFQDRSTILNADNDPLFGRSLLAMKGREWKCMRATLSPAFTSSKIRAMFGYISQCGRNTAEYYERKFSEGGIVEVDLKDAFTRYTVDVIAASVYGIKIDSLNVPDNEFYKMGQLITKVSLWKKLKIMAYMTAPQLMKIFNVKLYDDDVVAFFNRLVSDRISENKIGRHDMIHLLTQTNKGLLPPGKHNESEDSFAAVAETKMNTKIKKLSDQEIAAQTILFFFAGVDTTSTVLSFMIHELTLNVTIQKKLQSEIDDVMTDSDGSPTYEQIQGMKYMDMVVSETLRKWPPGWITDRRCSRTYGFKLSGNRFYKMSENETIWIPIYSIHHDSNYYKNPDKFDPERFSEANRQSIRSYTYIPFGIGPRNCIGSRFAILEVKSVVCHLLYKFDLIATSRTANPIVVSPKMFNLGPEGGFWAGFKLRTIR